LEDFSSSIPDFFIGSFSGVQGFYKHESQQSNQRQNTANAHLSYTLQSKEEI
jgi:hypothetical protein